MEHDEEAIVAPRPLEKELPPIAGRVSQTEFRENVWLTVALRAIFRARDRETFGCACGLAERGCHSVGSEGVAGECAMTTVLSAASSGPHGRAWSRRGTDHR